MRLDAKRLLDGSSSDSAEPLRAGEDLESDGSRTIGKGVGRAEAMQLGEGQRVPCFNVTLATFEYSK